MISGDNPLDVTFQTQPSVIVQNSDDVLGTFLLGTNSSLNDAFSRLRVSNPTTLLESSMEVDDQPLIWDTLNIGTGGTVYNTNESSVSLSTGGNSSSSIRQTHQYVRYQPGKSLMVLFSLLLGSRATDVTRRVGLFDADNGVFLEQTGTDIAWVRRTNVTGSPIDNRVVQTSWNVDVLDGSGSSGLTLDETTTLLGIIDLQWLGVGRIRTGFALNGRIIYANEFLPSIPTVYMSRASLPMRYEISSGAGAGGSSSLTQICCTVISEGGFQPKGVIRSFGNAKTTRTLNSDTYTPIVGIRFKTAYIKSNMFPLSTEIASSSGNLVHYRLVLRCSIDDGAWVSVSEAAQGNVTGTSSTGGVIIYEGYLSNQSRLDVSQQESSVLVNSSDISGVPDVMCVDAISFSGSQQVSAAIQWREIY
jgi:hypothetical protein